MQVKVLRLKPIAFVGTLAFGILVAWSTPWGRPHRPDSARPNSPNDLQVSFTGPGTIEEGLPRLSSRKFYSLALSVPSPMALGNAQIRATVRDAQTQIAVRTIHRGDPDLYFFFRPAADGDVRLRLDLEGTPDSPFQCRIRWIAWDPTGKDAARLETEPNDTWQQANPIELEETVYATTDDAPYIAVGKDQERDVLNRGVDWYRLKMTNDRPLLVFFEIDVQERDNIPMDVSVYQLESSRLLPYEKGMDPVSPPHEVQALPGNKFTTRVLGKGTYYIRVAASHPAYSLRTQFYEVPPYSDPHLAVRAGMDYLAGAGDSWHANTPRRGGITDRVANYHAETSTCIACHPTHFTTRGNLIANANGYPIRMRREMQFLTERLYNNPRPFYGFPEASWSRLISASANVMSRLAALLNYFEHNVSGEPREGLMKGVAEYLKLYYRDRTSLPPDETNGNTPIVSTYEVAFYSWMVFDELYSRSGDLDCARYRDQIRKLLEETKHKNLLDLCYQTIALATIDKDAYRTQIQANAERILSLQRPSGQWAMLFEPDAPEAEFQTGHCLYTLALAGYNPKDPRIAKGLQYLLKRQQEFGGWFDPLQSYENFRTPFRETQFAVMALSVFYNGAGGKGWGAGFPRGESNPSLDFSRGLSSVLKDLDGIWEKPSQITLKRIEELGGHPEALVRQAALTTLGRVGELSSIPVLSRGLSDHQKIVQYSAAWALRQLATRKRIGIDSISFALSSPDDRTRWGAARVFSTHFSYLSGNLELGEKILAMMHDPSPILRMQACKALWQWWYWNTNPSFRDRVEDRFLERMAVERDSWVRRNLTEGFYNICDENVRYLYNNWIALLARPEDRSRAAAGHQAVGTALARKIARALSDVRSDLDQNRLVRDGILTSLTHFHLRHSDPSKPEVYARIGNDVETIKFYSEAASILEPVLVNLIQDSSPAVRKFAIQASAIVRDNSMKLFAPALVRSLEDPEPDVRRMGSRFYKTLALPTDGENRPTTATLLTELIQSQYRTATLAALDLVASTRGKLAEEAKLSETIKAAVLKGDPDITAAALGAAATLPALVHDAEVLLVAQKALTAASHKSSAAQVPEGLLATALEIAITQPALASQRETVESLDRLIADRESRVWKLILDISEKKPVATEHLQVISLISEALLAKNETLRRQAREIVRKNPKVGRNPGVAAALAELEKRASRPQGPTGRESYVAATGKTSAAVPLPSLDFNYFVERVMPILKTPGPDGAACVYCHATHTILKLNPPPREGDYSQDQLRENYRSALRVVDPDVSENSLLLRKPLSTAETEGTIGSGKLSHGGGLRWSSSEDPAYKIILEWIRGAKVDFPSKRAER